MTELRELLHDLSGRSDFLSQQNPASAEVVSNFNFSAQSQRLCASAASIVSALTNR